MNTFRFDSFLILAWLGPSYERLQPRALHDLAAAGFNASLSLITEDQVPSALDMAREAGVRLIIGVTASATDPRPPRLRITEPGQADEGYRHWLRGLMQRVRGHPALLGYYIADEPRAKLLDDIGHAWQVWRDTDPDHLFYVNHWTVSQTWNGARSYEDYWERACALAPPQLVSSDLYPIRVVSEEDWQAHRDEPNYFPRHKAQLDLPYFEMLDLVRQFSFRWHVPMWMCNRSVPRYSQPTAEGEARFQVMCNLAYGAKAIQYFSYQHQNHLIDERLEPTENWHVVRHINQLVRAWGPVLMRLRSIGVYHHPANLPYTRPLDQFVLGAPTDLFSRGDAVVVGQFVDDHEQEYVLLVNRNPFEPATVTFHFGTDEPVEECAADGQWAVVRPHQPRAQALSFAPGAGRLFRFRRPLIPPAPLSGVRQS